jgi:hypothetical protein
MDNADRRKDDNVWDMDCSVEGKNREETETGKPFDPIVAVVVLLEKERIRDSKFSFQLSLCCTASKHSPHADVEGCQDTE